MSEGLSMPLPNQPTVIKRGLILPPQPFPNRSNQIAKAEMAARDVFSKLPTELQQALHREVSGVDLSAADKPTQKISVLGIKGRSSQFQFKNPLPVQPDPRKDTRASSLQHTAKIRFLQQQPEGDATVRRVAGGNNDVTQAPAFPNADANTVASAFTDQPTALELPAINKVKPGPLAPYGERVVAYTREGVPITERALEEHRKQNSA